LAKGGWYCDGASVPIAKFANLAAAAYANFGIKGGAAFETVVRNRACCTGRANFGFAALAGSTVVRAVRGRRTPLSRRGHQRTPPQSWAKVVVANQRYIGRDECSI